MLYKVLVLTNEFCQPCIIFHSQNMDNFNQETFFATLDYIDSNILTIILADVMRSNKL